MTCEIGTVSETTTNFNCTIETTNSIKANPQMEFCALKVNDHIKPHYEKFREWWLSTYASFGEIVIPLSDRFFESPRKISFQQVLFDAYMSKENEIQQLKQKIALLEKGVKK